MKKNMNIVILCAQLVIIMHVQFVIPTKYQTDAMENLSKLLLVHTNHSYGNETAQSLERIKLGTMCNHDNLQDIANCYITSVLLESRQKRNIGMFNIDPAGLALKQVMINSSKIMTIMRNVSAMFALSVGRSPTSRSSISDILNNPDSQSFKQLELSVAATSAFEKMCKKKGICDMNKVHVNSTLCTTNTHINCTILENSKYRTINGTCNNLFNPFWGAAHMEQIRFVKPQYGDYTKAQQEGFQDPRTKSVGKKGAELPNPRTLSRKVFGRKSNLDTHISHFHMTFGQFVDHDLSLTPTFVLSNMKKPKCCRVKKSKMHTECFPIKTDRKDRSDPYNVYNHKCQEFVRSMAAGCKMGPRQQMNEITSYLDASMVYGSTEKQAKKLRTDNGDGAYLASYNTSFSESEVKSLLPQSKESCGTKCVCPREELECFESGDKRTNAVHTLTACHTIFMRLHNDLVDKLTEIGWKNPEELYQEARRLVGAILQHITYSEFLPKLLGGTVMHKYHLNPSTGINYYNPHLQADIRNEFSTAAFRYGHSQIRDKLGRFFIKRECRGCNYGRQMKRGQTCHTCDGQNRYENIPAPLTHCTFQPESLYYSGIHEPFGIDPYLRGMLFDQAEQTDMQFTPNVGEFLFIKVREFGVKSVFTGRDLGAINIQRGRDHGIPGFNKYRKLCGYHPIRMFNRYKWKKSGKAGTVSGKWWDVEGFIKRKHLTKMRKQYKPYGVDDIDLFIGALAETPVKGGIVGPVFACLIALQFQNLKYGDRYWHEWPSQFTRAQLTELRKVTLSRVLCDESDSISEIQPDAMSTISSNNKITSCKDIPKMNMCHFMKPGTQTCKLENAK